MTLTLRPAVRKMQQVQTVCKTVGYRNKLIFYIFPTATLLRAYIMQQGTEQGPQNVNIARALSTCQVHIEDDAARHVK